MGRPIKVIGYLCFLMALCSCKETKEQQISRLIHEWEGRTIVYPADMTFSVLGKGSADYSFPQNEYTIMICIFQREKRKLQYTYTDLQPLLMKLLIPHHYQPIRKEVMCAKVANFIKTGKGF